MSFRLQQQAEIPDRKQRKRRVTGCATLTIHDMKVSSFPGIISRDRNVLGQEQEKRSRGDLFLDLRQEQVKEDMGEGGFDSAG